MHLDCFKRASLLLNSLTALRSLRRAKKKGLRNTGLPGRTEEHHFDLCLSGSPLRKSR